MDFCDSIYAIIYQNMFVPYGSQKTIQHFVLNSLAINPTEKIFQVFGLVGIGPFKVKGRRLGKKSRAETF